MEMESKMLKGIKRLKRIAFLIVAIVVAVTIAATIPSPSLKVPIAVILFLMLSCIRYTTVEEGTAKLIMRLGGVVKVFIQWTGYKLDKKGNVVPVGYELDENYNLVPMGEKIPEKPKRPWYGGLRIWIGTPFDKVHEYNLRYHSVEEVEGKRIPVFHEIRTDCVMLRPDRYWRKTIQVETKDGQFPDVEWQIGMRSENPEKTIFKSPHNWVENGLNELEPSSRSFARTKDLKPFLDLKRTQIWDEMKNDHAVTLLREEWGIKIDENEIAIFAVTPSKAYQEALAARSKAQMEAEAMKKRAEVEASGRAAEIMGTVIEAVVRATGLSKKKVKEEFQENPEAFYKKHKAIADNTMTKLSMEERAYLRIETPGAEGALGDFLRLIGAWQRIPGGKPPEEKRLQKGEERKKIREKKQKWIEDMTSEEYERYMEEMYFEEEETAKEEEAPKK